MNQNEIEHHLRGICERLEAWSKSPTISVSGTVRLTGISRARVRQLLEAGVFLHGSETENREILLETVLKYFLRRVSKLSGVGKSQRKGLPKV